MQAAAEVFDYITTLQPVSDWRYLGLYNLNDKGQVVWTGDDSEPVKYSMGVYFLDSAGILNPSLIYNHYANNKLLINDGGQITWKANPGSPYDVSYLYDLNTKVRTTSDIDVAGLNDQGQAVASKYDGSDWEIYFYDPLVSTKSINISNNASNDYLGDLNDLGQVVWSHLDKTIADLDIYLYDTGTGAAPRNLSNTAKIDESAPIINNRGQVAWWGDDGTYKGLYLYNLDDSAGPVKIFQADKIGPFVYGFPSTKINNLGQVAWVGYNGDTYEIYLYDPNHGPTPRKIAEVPYNSDSTIPPLELNDLGQVVWTCSTSPTDSGYDAIYLYDRNLGESPVKIFSAAPDENNGLPRLNNSGQILWSTYKWEELSEESYLIYDFDLNLGTTYQPYGFKFTYANGDYYTGTVYAATDKGYYPGKAWTKKDENGLLGTYTITGVGVGQDAYAGLLGQVFVDNYYDAESKKLYKPVHKGKAVGTAFLGSEVDYIGVDAVNVYRFGKGYYEADVGDKYKFRYTYGNGDYYEGYVYRMPGYVYYPGYKFTKKNELGLTGTYEILSMTYTGDTAKYHSGYGEVYVNTYHDGESKKNFTPLKKGKAVGTAFLGSESGLYRGRRRRGLQIRQGLLPKPTSAINIHSATLTATATTIRATSTARPAMSTIPAIS